MEWAVGGRDGGDDTLERMAVAFERAGDELADFGRYLFPRMTPVFEREMAEQFDAEGQGASGSWAALSTQYAEWKAEHYPGKDILQREGVLHEALTSSASPFAKRVISGDEFDFGTVGIEYASYVTLGTSRLPARPVFDFGSDFERIVTQTGAEAAREAMKDAGVEEFATVSE